MFRLLAMTALTVTTVLVPASPAAASNISAVSASTATASTDGALARQVARSLAAPQARQRLFAATSAGPADLLAIMPGMGLARQVNQETLAAKGLPASSGSILQIRLANPGLGDPLVAMSPNDDAASIVAYDSRGRAVHLDAVTKPQRPVFVIEVDVDRSVELGLPVLRRELAARGVLTQPLVSTASGYWATMITAVRLQDDKEPWTKGAAEIFSIVGGWGLDGVATAAVVQMPYLDHDGTTYYPNQLVVHFNAYKYNLADIVMMEDDGATNYQQLAIAIANVLLTLVDAGAYAPLVTAILNAIPTGWWTDDPDYVDSWYTLATSSNGRLNGAAANGWMDVVPYWVEPL
jgi:Protein of unknown function (DUF3103)